jgi:hypothetical protein
MPFNPNGPNASVKIGTYNDIAGNQTNNTKTTTTGNIASKAISPCLCHCLLIHVLIQLEVGVVVVEEWELGQLLVVKAPVAPEELEVTLTFPEGNQSSVGCFPSLHV